MLNKRSFAVLNKKSKATNKKPGGSFTMAAFKINVQYSACSASCNLSLSALEVCHLDLGKIIFSLLSTGCITQLLISTSRSDLEIPSALLVFLVYFKGFKCFMAIV